MQTLNNSQNQSLIRQAQRGSTTAFSQLYEEIYKDLYRFALYTLKHPHDAEDAVSEAVTQSFEKIKTLRSHNSFKSWMFQILSNQCRKKLNYKQRVRPEDGLQNFEEVVPQDLGNDLSLQEAFYRLDDEDRLIVALSVFGGSNSTEIGQQLDLNPATVRSKLSRALAKLRLFLGEEI